MIKSMVKDFYTLEAISNAKQSLIQDITKADITVKIPANRRNSNSNKQKLDIDDIMTLMDSVDERNGLDKLPRYVTDDLDDVPICKMDSGGLSVLLTKLDSIEEKVSSNWFRDSRLSSALPKRNISGRPIDMEGEVNGDSISSDPFPENDFREVISKNKKRKIISGELSCPSANPSGNQRNDDPPASTSLSLSQIVQKGLNSTNRPKLQKRIIGRSNVFNSQQSTLRSAKPYVKKEVFGIYNVDPSATVDSVEQFVMDVCGVNRSHVSRWVLVLVGVALFS